MGVNSTETTVQGVITSNLAGLITIQTKSKTGIRDVMTKITFNLYFLTTEKYFLLIQNSDPSYQLIKILSLRDLK